MKKQIVTEMYAFIAEESPGNEGVIGMSLDIPGVGPSFTPLVGADMDRIESLRPHAIMIGKTTGCPIKLKRFKLISEEII